MDGRNTNIREGSASDSSEAWVAALGRCEMVAVAVGGGGSGNYAGGGSGTVATTSLVATSDLQHILVRAGAAGAQVTTTNSNNRVLNH